MSLYSDVRNKMEKYRHCCDNRKLTQTFVKMIFYLGVASSLFELEYLLRCLFLSLLINENKNNNVSSSIKAV